MSSIQFNKVIETNEQPKMMEVYLEQSWQNAFCYALACEEPERNHMKPKLMMAIISGSDSTLQSIKAAIDIGSDGLYFGFGKKGLTGYDFVRDFQISSDKGSYEKFPITINNNRKALAIVHDELLGNREYVISFEGDPAEDIRQVLGGGKYGLHILPEWKDTIYQALIKRGYLEEVELYFDKGLFPNGISLLKVNMEEEQADTLISELVKASELTFPREGTGSALESTDDLTTYMQGYVNDMVAKVSEEVNPTHNPMTDQSFKHFESYKRELFPVQAHVSTAIAKRLKEQKSLIIQGEMSTGKTTMLVALADAYYKEKQKEGYFACVLVPPSLTKKWPEEIKEIIPNAVVHVIDETKKLIQFHRDWTNSGRPKPTKPTFFVISFTIMRGDCANVPVVEFERIKTMHQVKHEAKPYRYGFYCPDCGKAHQVIESSTVQLNENGEEETVHHKRSMGPDEFGETRRLHNAQKPANAYCTECGSSLWTKKVPTRYSSFKEWAKHERKIVHAANDKNSKLVKHLQDSQPEMPKMVGRPRRIATIEYIRRKMNNFFDISLIDEIHELKAGNSAQGNSLGSLAAVSKKVVGGTGTLFGGKAEDVYYRAPCFSTSATA
ncbi:DEAD/DEAH box helicase family protein [Metabacillus herbersteinensis]|uniref:DEAD/DEAH box helicase family protein n=1 Tax=Metabacillus herbersteinensis TaxID=283816 RepID=A0ABV6GIS9_9BACI